MDQPVNETQNQQQDDKWYQDFLENYDYESPKPGQLIEGTILSIEDDGIQVDVGLKRDALVPSRDLSQIDSEKLAQFNVGDKIFVHVMNRAVGDKDLLVSLSKGLEYESWERAEEHLKNSMLLSLEVIGHNRGGLIVKFESLRGFLPYSQVPGLSNIRNQRAAERMKRDMIGKELEMKVIEVVRERNRLILSATAAQKEKRQQCLDELKRGEIVTGKVVNIVDFGVFINLGEIDGLVHVSQLDWKKVSHPSELYKVGDEIEVKILDVDVERERVSLSRKAVIPSPWETPEELPEVGECVEGRIVKLVDFGAFVELPIGIEGLVHTSQLGYTYSENPSEAVKRGEVVLVRVISVEPDRRRISLSMRQVPRETQIAWAMENIEELLSEETSVEKTQAQQEPQPEIVEAKDDSEAETIEAPETEEITEVEAVEVLEANAESEPVTEVQPAERAEAPEASDEPVGEATTETEMSGAQEFEDPAEDASEPAPAAEIEQEPAEAEVIEVMDEPAAEAEVIEVMNEPASDAEPFDESVTEVEKPEAETVVVDQTE